MAELAIRGHESRGKEVIEILEMLGGVNKHQIDAIRQTYVYFIDIDNIIRLLQIGQLRPQQYVVYSLEQFEEKFPYKVGDKVYYQPNPQINTICISEIISMKWADNSVIYFTSNGHELYACDLQPYMETITIDDFKANTKEWLIEKLHGMIISDAIKTIGNIHDELHKPKYPETYEKCCTYLGLQHCGLTIDLPLNYSPLFISLAQLYICRNAYWKIAGEQMGLGKSWNQDYHDRCFIIANNKGDICTYEYHGSNNVILAFPTEEMRDEFYNNFKDLIEQCKELL